MDKSFETLTPSNVHVVFKGENPFPDVCHIILLGESSSKHYKARFNSEMENSVFVINNQKYEIRKDKLYKCDYNAFERFIDKLTFKRVRYYFVCFFKEGDSEPLTFDFPSDLQTSSRLTYIVLKNSLLKRGITAEFTRKFALPLNVKTVFFIVIVVCVVAFIAYMLMSGAFRI
ncbi:MAG: hypothetical protein ACKD6O_08105 [Candidatus Bathyarchaeota archaeon]